MFRSHGEQILLICLVFFKFDSQTSPSIWRPFFSALPSVLNTPLCFTEETLEMIENLPIYSMHFGTTITYVADEIQAQRDELQTQFKAIRGQLNRLEV